MRKIRLAMIGLLAGVMMTLPGCMIGNLLGGMAQNAEYQKLPENNRGKIWFLYSITSV